MPEKEELISSKEIEEELKVMNARVNDMDGVKKEIEKYYNNPELLESISSPQEKAFYEKMVDKCANKNGKNITKNASLKKELTINKQSGFVSLIYVTAILLILLLLLSVL